MSKNRGDKGEKKTTKAKKTKKTTKKKQKTFESKPPKWSLNLPKKKKTKRNKRQQKNKKCGKNVIKKALKCNQKTHQPRKISLKLKRCQRRSKKGKKKV